MSIEILLDQISSSLTKLSIETRVNSYNLLAGRLDKPQYKILFPENFDSKLVSSTPSPESLKAAGLAIEEQEQSVDEIMLRAIEISSENNRLVTLMNARLELERMMIKGRR